MLKAPNLARFSWLIHGFGVRESVYPAGVTTLRQIHSAVVLEAVGPGADRFADGDALVSNEPGSIVGVRTADCVPILIADERSRAVAAIHSGWRGAAAGIAVVAATELITRYGARAEDLHAAIGPAIGACCYEVGPEVARQFGKEPSGPVKIDLAAIVARQLADMGVTDIWQSGQCTFCESDRYFSYRREKEAAGRMLSFIGIEALDMGTA
jgi:YfiH family protein